MAAPQRTTTTAIEALAVTGMAFGMFVVFSVRAVLNNFASVPFSDGALLWMMFTEVTLASAAIAFLYIRGFAITTLRPIPTVKGAFAGIVLFFVAWLVGQLFVAPFAAGQPQQPIEAMLTDARVSLPVIVTMAMINGVFEEVFLLGFLLRGLRGFGISVALGITLLVRVLCHLYQGPLGPLFVIGVGLTFAVYYMRSSQLWPPVFAHVLWDIVPFVFA